MVYFQGDRKLKLTLKQIQEYDFPEVFEHIGKTRCEVLNRNRGEKVILSLAPGIIKGLYQKVADFPIFLSFNSNLYQNSLVMDIKLMKFISTKKVKTDRILITNEVYAKTIEIKEISEHKLNN
jgi:hypothetical protein